MRIGINLTSVGPQASTSELIASAAAAKARGLDSAWTNQQPGGWDPLTVLTALHDAPGELGTGIVPTYPRHPVALATEALTVQALTGGRLTLGIGPSHAMYVTDQLGLPYDAPATHTREYLEVLNPLLRGEHVTHTGRFFTVDTELAVTAPPPPVLLSALGPRMLEIARDLADGTIAVWLRPNIVADYLRPRLGDHSRIALMSQVALTNDPDATREQLARDLEFVNHLPVYRAFLDRGGLASAADTVIVGDEAAIERELHRFRDAGATDLILNPLGATPADRDRVLDVIANVNLA